MAPSSTNLEPFEMEGLMSDDGNGNGGMQRAARSSRSSGRSSGSNSSHCGQVMAQSCDFKNRKRGILIGFILVPALLLLIMAANDTGAVGDSTVLVDDGSSSDNGPQPPEGEGVVFVEPEEKIATTPARDTNNPPPPEAGSDDKTETKEIKTEEIEEIKETEETEIGETETDASPAPKSKERNSNIPLLEPDKEAGAISDEKHDELIDVWGGWHFWDGDEELRPTEDFLSKHPNMDIPGDDFPEDSWQIDAVYVNHYLDAADKLIDRAMEAIFTEYGHGKPLPPKEMAARTKMVHWEKLDMSAATEPPPEFKGQRGDIGGWTSTRSFDGLVRRLLHAMLTRDTFTVVVAGTSSSTQGNHFRQSYAMQFHRIMEPIFARLNVKLITHNMAQDGMGAKYGGIGARDIYGQDIDLFLWDDDDSESLEYTDLVLRQVLMSSKRVPLIWGGPFELLKLYHEEADADIGDFGTGYAGLPETTNEAQAETLPWAARNMKCSSEGQDLCNENRYNAVCWIDRTDGIKPARDQLQHPEGQDEGQSGWRSHQLQGRVLAFSVLEGLEVAVNTWMEGTMTGQPLDDDYWHVTEYYENIRSKIKNMDQKLGRCPDIGQDDQLPIRMCNTPMNGRTQYTPRADYDGASLNSIVKAAHSGDIPTNIQKPLYEGPDMHNPVYDVPEGQIDVLSIVAGRRQRRRLSEHELKTHSTFQNTMGNLNLAQLSQQQQQSYSLRRQLGDERITPGEGWDITLEPQGHCDGTYDSVCAHGANEECFLLGRHEQRGAIVGCEWSGWLVMTLKALKEGIIVIKLQTWHEESENPKTKDWKAVNIKRRLGEHDSDAKELYGETSYHRMGDLTYPDIEKMSQNATIGRRRIEKRSADIPELPDIFAFDYAINGKITTLNKAEFLAKNSQRVLETMTLLDDPEFTKEEKDVEVAIRLRGVERKLFFGLSHIYWA